MTGPDPASGKGVLTAGSELGRPRLVAIGLMCAALVCFTCGDTSAKYLNRLMDIVQVVWARYAGAFLFAMVLFNPWSHPGMLRTTRPWLQLGRSSLLLISTACNFLALQHLRLDQVTAIGFTTPFFIAVLAGPLLGEWIGWRRWTAIGVGFLGVLVVARPGFGGIHPAAVFSVITCIAYAFYAISTRILARTDSTETTLFYTNVVGFGAACLGLPFVWTTPQDLGTVVCMIVIGLFGGFGHYLMISAHRLAPAAILSPFVYTQLLWMGIAGYVVFGDMPDRWTLVGAAIVVASGLYLLYRERVVKGL